MKTIPQPKIKIPLNWSSTQALCVIEFLHTVADEIWDWYERPICEYWKNNRIREYDANGCTRPNSSYKTDISEEENEPF